ncbi:tyrosine-type recombinase/integrase [Planctomycetota bacterium]|nr:tyrosine-type recombinase/integrase [Planctomycetota bacterium]
MRSFWGHVNKLTPDTIPAGCIDALKLPKGMRSPPVQVLSLQQQVALLEFAWPIHARLWPTRHLYAFVLFGLNMALRPAEIVHLDWSEIVKHGDNWFVRIRDLPRRKAKNDRARIAVALCPVLLSVLRDNFDWKSSGPVFPSASASGSHRHHLCKAKELLGAPWFNLFALRRCCITNWYNSGMDTRCITALSRHCNDVTTMRRYIEPAQFVGADGFPVSV